MDALQLHPQFVVDENGERKSVLLSVEEFDALVEFFEDQYDIRVLERAIDESKGERRNIRDIIRELEPSES
jgi:hypothetical protein